MPKKKKTPPTDTSASPAALSEQDDLAKLSDDQLDAKLRQLCERYASKHSEADLLPAYQPETHIADVYMLRLKRPTTQYTLETYTARNPSHPKVTLVMVHAEQCWKVEGRYIPFCQALEFELA